MNNTVCVLLEPLGQCHSVHLTMALTLPVFELGRKAFLGSRMGLAEPPEGTVLEGEAPSWPLACTIQDLGLLQ